MSVSKRLRFEILRRDNHACRYCGATPAERPLQVDHVIPATLGGPDDPSNLVTACVDCNAGKSSSAPDEPIVDDVAEDALRWRKAMERVARERAKGHRKREQELFRFHDGWERGWLPDNWQESVSRWLDLGLSISDLMALQGRTFSRGRNTYWTYFCGAAWGTLRDYQDRAAEIIAAEDQS